MMHAAARRRSEQSYPVIQDRFDPRAERSVENRTRNLEMLGRVEDAWTKALAGGGERYTTRHRAAGKLLPRERVELLLDPGSFYLELCGLAAHEVDGQETGAAIIGGIGLVSGVPCMIIASEATIKGGAVSELGVAKTRRLAEIAEQNRLVTINMVESAGADLPNQDKIFIPGGQGFRDLTRASKARRPTICMVFGSSTAGGAYVPGMSDYAIMVKEQAQVYLAGPPLVKMAIGEDTDHESLGGAEMHSRVSGVSDYLAEDEVDAIRIGREIVAQLGYRGAGPMPEFPAEAPAPRYPAEDLLGIISADLRHPFDARDVLARIVDDSRFTEFKPLYGDTLVCGWAHIGGFRVGVLANNGILFPDSSNKGAQFIALCNQTDTPLLFLQNITGFMVGSQVEQAGIIKHGAKLINAVSNSTVPAITIMVGASYGAGNYAMAGRAYQPRFLFTLPGHKIAVMGGKQMAGVLEIIKREAAAKKGVEVDEDQLNMLKFMIEHQIDQQSDCLYASARLWDDGIIDPRHMRQVVSLSLAIAHQAPVEGTMAWGVYRH
jgi:acetyl-CoA carboxylase carboxyltransferase component